MAMGSVQTVVGAVIGLENVDGLGVFLGHGASVGGELVVLFLKVCSNIGFSPA
jgi:hypothetical protein